MGRGRPKKDKFADLPEEFKNSVAAMDEAGIRSELAKITLAQAANLQAKEQDQDLAEKKEAAKEAGAQYREATKMNKTKVNWCKQVLEDKGKL